MANWKLTFLFENGQAGWSESYYRIAANVSAATAFTSSFWPDFFNPRGDQTICYGIRVSDADTPRSGTLVKVFKRRSVVGLGSGVGDDPPSMTAEIAVTALFPARRTVLVRGLKDYSYARIGGVFNPASADYVGFITFVNTLILNAFMLRILNPANGANPDRPILQVAAGTDPERQTVVTYDGIPIAPDWRVVFHRLPGHWFPALRGNPLPSAVTATTLEFPVRFTGPTPVVVVPGATLRRFVYSYDGIISGALSDIRSRRTGRPSGLSRGRASPAHYRAR